MKTLFLWSAIFLIILAVGIVLFAPFIAPYDPTTQFRASAHSPPTWPIVWNEEDGLTYPYLQKDDAGRPGKAYVDFFVEGKSYDCLGLTLDRHLFGLADKRIQLFLLGTDALGRDLFSRLIFGIRFSVLIGIAGLFLSFSLAVPLGALAGYREGWWDRVIMRVCDLFLSLPGLFLVLGVRAVFPLEVSTLRMFWLIVVVFALIGWGAVTRVVRGQVISLKQRPFVLAARLGGASDWWLISRHILPFTTNYLVVQATVFLPLFILGEITLSFLGVGVQEPGVSLGTLLNESATLQAFRLYPWELVPAAVIFGGLFVFNMVGDQLRSYEKMPFSLW